ncbi:hypothetical protein GcM3_148017 [Golovinomyces cichoracearum]|uniref:Uncharacterized protein n=1 Tax=Golovinomyces cichoracearum TaxID=62708 RepID=A0A420HY49_9PEZI|nr:hypothetical protein GcM3_148017 [Golovinomyces cichoracearum]
MDDDLGKLADVEARAIYRSRRTCSMTSFISG